MLPKEYRQRYVLFFALSFLLHLAVVLFLIWNPIFETPKKDKGTTVEIKLNQTKKTEPLKKPEEKKKAQDKKSSKKKAEEQASRRVYYTFQKSIDNL